MKIAPRDRIVIKTSRLLPVLIALVVPFEVAAKEPIAPPSVSCPGPEGERYLQTLLDRIHHLETQLDAEVEAHLTERAEAERRLQDVTNELTQQAAAALAPAKQPTTVEGFDPEQAKKQLAALKAALDEATAARRSAEAEAAAASQTAVTFANALKEVEGRLDAAEKKSAPATLTRVENDEAAEVKGTAAAPTREAMKAEAATPSPTKPPAALSESERPVSAPTAEPRAETQAAAPLLTPTPAAPSESELAAAQLAALSGKRAAPAVHDAPPPTAPMREPEPSVQAVKPIATKAPVAVSESDRAAAQLAALSGKPAPPFANPALPPVAREAETTSAPPTPARASIASPPPRTRCDEPLKTARIEPGDRLAIHVDHLKEVSDTVEVGSDGRVHLSLVGTVPAAGRNQREFVADLTQRLTVYLQAPRVDVALKRDCGR
jgi:hypothetical protein